MSRWGRPAGAVGRGRGVRAGRVSGAGAGAAAARLAGAARVGAVGAAGSHCLYPGRLRGGRSTGNSADRSSGGNVKWRNAVSGPPAGGQIHRRFLVGVYLQAGEVLLTGSSAVGVGSGDIVVYK